MARNGTNPNLDALSLSDNEADDTEDLFASPLGPAQKSHSRHKLETKQEAGPPQLANDEEEACMAHEASLRRELASLRNMNQVISGITASLDKAKSNMDAVSTTVNNASTLLATWTRILSQTEHNQRLILNPEWQGATQDIADGENEELRSQQEKERREAEEAKRAQEREAEREEEERRRAGVGNTGKGGRSRGKVVGRGAGRAGGTSYVSVGGQGGGRGTARGGLSAGRTSSGIGRGLNRGRGRGRG